MDSEEVLEAVLRSRSVFTGPGTAITLAVFGESRGVVRRLLQKANCCPRIGRTLTDFVEWNPRSNKKNVDLQQQQQQQHEILRQRNAISEPNPSNSTNSTVVDDHFLDCLRAQLLRIRVASLVRQDFVLAKQLGELKDLCQAVCADNGLGGDVFERLWDVVARGVDPMCTPHTTSGELSCLLRANFCLFYVLSWLFQVLEALFWRVATAWGKVRLHSLAFLPVLVVRFLTGII